MSASIRLLCLILAILAFGASARTMDKSKSLIDSLTPLLQSHTAEDTTRVNILCELAKNSVRFNIENTMKYATEALRISEKIEYRRGIGLAHKSMGNFYMASDRFVQAQEHLYKARVIFTEIGEDHELAVTANNTGIICRKQRKFEDALKNYGEALRIYRKLKDSSYEASTMMNMGVSFKNLKRYDSAMAYYQASLKLSSTLKENDIVAKNLGDISLLFEEQKQLDSALAYADSSLHIRRALKSNKLMPPIFSSICKILNGQGKFSDAKMACDSALAYAAKDSSLEVKETLYGNLAKTYAGLGQFDKAYEALQTKLKFKDSMFSADKSQALGKLEAGFEIEKKMAEEELKRQKEEEAQKQKARLQYSAIFIIVLGVFFGLLFLGKVNIPLSAANKAIVLSTLLLFEFLLLLSDPFLGGWTNGEPAYVLLTNLVIAIIFIPLDDRLRHLLAKRLLKAEKND